MHGEASFCIELSRGACFLGGTSSGRGWISGGVETGSSLVCVVVAVCGTSSNRTWHLCRVKKNIAKRRGTKTKTVTDVNEGRLRFIRRAAFKKVSDANRLEEN